MKFREINATISINVQVLYQPVQIDRHAEVVFHNLYQKTIIHRSAFVGIPTECHKCVHYMNR